MPITIICKDCSRKYKLTELIKSLEGECEYLCICGHILIPKANSNWKTKKYSVYGGL